MGIPKHHLAIKDWAIDDKPREKLLEKGSSVLSDAEIIAILIRSGNRYESAVELSKRILSSVDHDLDKLGRLSVDRLLHFKGIGEAKAITITAALELGRRKRLVGAFRSLRIHKSSDVFELMYPVIGDLPHEEFWVLYLNNSNKLLAKDLISKGGITGTLVDVRLVLKRSLELGAIGLILIHNHPSGALRPSNQDKQVTKKMKNAANTIDIKILDHVILAEKNYFSFADEGIL
ncbi:MAG: DNA repair protein RadC [Flavobacteriaceae bacterium]|nr:DNA repair protein RadC [Flavobacteriaceae bacterium]